MGKKWIYRLKKEDSAYVAQRLNMALEGKAEDRRRALSEYYSETENDPKLVGIWTELEAANPEKTGPSITLTNAELENLVASLCFDNLQREGQKRDANQESKRAAPISGPNQPDYAKGAKQVRKWLFRVDGGEKPFDLIWAWT